MPSVGHPAQRQRAGPDWWSGGVTRVLAEITEQAPDRSGNQRRRHLLHCCCVTSTAYPPQAQHLLYDDSQARDRH